MVEDKVRDTRILFHLQNGMAYYTLPGLHPGQSTKQWCIAPDGARDENAGKYVISTTDPHP